VHGHPGPVQDQGGGVQDRPGSRRLGLHRGPGWRRV
jgi:hypothetical protein